MPCHKWNRPRVARWEHVDHAMDFPASQDGGVDLPAAGREIVHAQHARRAGLRIGQCHDPAQQGHPSDTKTQLGSQSSPARPSSEGEPDTLQGGSSRVVKRAYGAANCANGSAKVRRRQLAVPPYGPRQSSPHVRIVGESSVWRRNVPSGTSTARCLDKITGWRDETREITLEAMVIFW